MDYRLKKIEMWTLMVKDYYRDYQLYEIGERLSKIATNENLDNCLNAINFHLKKSPIITLILGILFGYLGVDRFYLGDWKCGVGKLLLTLFFGIGIIWAIVDLFILYGKTKDDNFIETDRLLKIYNV